MLLPLWDHLFLTVLDRRDGDLHNNAAASVELSSEQPHKTAASPRAVAALAASGGGRWSEDDDYDDSSDGYDEDEDDEEGDVDGENDVKKTDSDKDGTRASSSSSKKKKQDAEEVLRECEVEAEVYGTSAAGQGRLLGSFLLLALLLRKAKRLKKLRGNELRRELRWVGAWAGGA